MVTRITATLTLDIALESKTLLATCSAQSPIKKSRGDKGWGLEPYVVLERHCELLCCEKLMQGFLAFAEPSKSSTRMAQRSVKVGCCIYHITRIYINWGVSSLELITV